MGAVAKKGVAKGQTAKGRGEKHRTRWAYGCIVEQHIGVRKVGGVP
jgi:hypothetical protein